jgi:pyruvate formate lyase activating enzyme
MKITNIQNTCFNDGPGIRTTIFFKGCTLHCPWCANPECIVDEKKFPSIQISSDDLFNKINKQKPYLINGGITFSGGECLLQLNENIDLLKKLKQNNFHTCCETSLFCSEKQLTDILEYIDLFIIDIKILDASLCKKKLNGNISQFYSNLNIIERKKMNYNFRMITIDDYTLTENNLKLINELLKQHKPQCFEFFNFHNLAKNKYINLKINYNDYKKADNFKIIQLKQILNNNIINFKELTL